FLWLKSHNIVYDFLENFERYLQETEKAESITHQLVKVPVGGDYALGKFFYEILISHIRSTKDFMAPFMNISYEEFDNLVNGVEIETQIK
ncbi:25169_t:CDS:1, partial [Dentiscutata erythropus]